MSCGSDCKSLRDATRYKRAIVYLALLLMTHGLCLANTPSNNEVNGSPSPPQLPYSPPSSPPLSLSELESDRRRVVRDATSTPTRITTITTITTTTAGYIGIRVRRDASRTSDVVIDDVMTSDVAADSGRTGTGKWSPLDTTTTTDSSTEKSAAQDRDPQMELDDNSTVDLDVAIGNLYPGHGNSSTQQPGASTGDSNGKGTVDMLKVAICFLGLVFNLITISTLLING